jgi:hypothetical protein
VLRARKAVQLCQLRPTLPERPHACSASHDRRGALTALMPAHPPTGTDASFGRNRQANIPQRAKTPRVQRHLNRLQHSSPTSIDGNEWFERRLTRLIHCPLPLLLLPRAPCDDRCARYQRSRGSSSSYPPIRPAHRAISVRHCPHIHTSSLLRRQSTTLSTRWGICVCGVGGSRYSEGVHGHNAALLPRNHALRQRGGGLSDQRRDTRPSDCRQSGSAGRLTRITLRHMS